MMTPHTMSLEDRKISLRQRDAHRDKSLSVDYCELTRGMKHLLLLFSDYISFSCDAKAGVIVVH